MNMGEPLKDKRLLVHKGDTITQNKEEYECIKEVSYFSEKDLKSAVEWLKEQLIKKMETKLKGKVCYPYTVVGDTIDLAFPDLQEIKKQGR